MSKIPSGAASAPGGEAAIARPPTQSAFVALLTRLHFYVGLFVGPFILVAAVTGTLFVLTPQIESRIYADALYTDATGPAHSLTEQIAAASTVIGPDDTLFSVRPAPRPGMTSRILFSEPRLQATAEQRAIFVDPVTLAIKGDMNVYGTSSTLPFRTTLDFLHRNLMLGDLGRNYSELAASWLWFAALGGIILWWQASRRERLARRPATGTRARLRRWHSVIGLWIAIGLFFLSATGLTWSRWAGGNIDVAREKLGWVTPPLSTRLTPQAMGGMPAMAGAANEAHDDHGGHAGHGGHTMPNTPVSTDYATRFDAIERSARQAGIDATDIEIRPPRKPDQAWTVRETDRAWPTQVDAIAIDGRDLSVVGRSDFATFPLIAKLIRWGIDTHMGILFGWVNQVLMALFGIALSAMVVLGYAMWWRRRPAPGAPVLTVTQAWTRLGHGARGGIAALAVAVGWALPALGVSLLVFLLVDIARWRLARRGARRAVSPVRA
ncbi:PepSY domain-containing protein [Bordetella sp. LUAb4]|uniref:PepSY-associated TM helix domain-containing protein n=1 Tax=Bordetella sp. LUAb4 TaxID=2843195 RepID=UPI001E59EBEC|nr:PepSY domain-containing protein [Bordetella sp. LUAb4]